MTNRPPPTYRDSIITSQPKPPNKNKPRKTVSLTPAETRVLMLLTTYQTLAGIGSQLGIARPTVKTHVQNIYKKLGATKRAYPIGAIATAHGAPLSASSVSLPSNTRPSRLRRHEPTTSCSWRGDGGGGRAGRGSDAGPVRTEPRVDPGAVA